MKFCLDFFITSRFHSCCSYWILVYFRFVLHFSIFRCVSHFSIFRFVSHFSIFRFVRCVSILFRSLVQPFILYITSRYSHFNFLFSKPCQRQYELLPSFGVRRPFTFHILIFSSENISQMK